MKRIDIYYGGEHYSIAGRDLALDVVEVEIATAFDSGATHWLEVNSGEGRMRPSVLAITPGTPIALTPAHED